MNNKVFGAASATMLTIGLLAPAGALAGDTVAGEKSFRKCQACHAVGADAQNKIGPMLNNVVGRPLGSVDGFEYSNGMTEMGAAGAVWTPETLDVFLLRPRDYVKGTKMSFPGLRKDDERENVIAYLMTFSDEGS